MNHILSYSDATISFMVLVYLLCVVFALESTKSESVFTKSRTDDSASQLFVVSFAPVLFRLNASKADAIIVSDTDGFC
jgi:hypothetical protein